MCVVMCCYLLLVLTCIVVCYWLLFVATCCDFVLFVAISHSHLLQFVDGLYYVLQFLIVLGLRRWQSNIGAEHNS